MAEILFNIYLLLLENIFPALLSSILLIMIIIFFAFISNYKIKGKYILSLLAILFLLSSIFNFDIREIIMSHKDSNKNIVKGQLNYALKQPYKAPEIKGIYKWFNSEPLKIAELQNKVVLIDFWTYSCINCVRTIPHIKSWHDKYADKGLVIIGVHSPEFPFEGKPKNVQKAIDKFDIKYPVAMDNHFVTWENYSNRYWPAHYLINKKGNVVYTHFGEGSYKVTENNIRYLLGLDSNNNKKESKSFVSPEQTHETYLGYLRAAREVKGDEKLKIHHWKLSGNWRRDKQYIESQSDNSLLTLNYKARNVYLVMESANNEVKQVAIYNNNKFIKTLDINKSDIYELVDNKTLKKGELQIKTLNKGVRLFAFTFGS